MSKQKSKVAILGTGNIGTDLLIKVMRSDLLECAMFAGRNLRSDGIRKASDLGVRVSDGGIKAILDYSDNIDLVFDATSAAAHISHWAALQDLDKLVIDMTPAKVGAFCVPALNEIQIINDGTKNINMITCGGQASIPIAHAIARVSKNIQYIEVASSISSASAGPATRANLDEYILTTEDALLKFSGAARAKAILILNPAQPPIYMETTIYAKFNNPDISKIRQSVNKMVSEISSYIPGYEIILQPTLLADRVVTTVRVIGNGDYLPKYAGNLDIINCAAIRIAERFASKELLCK